MLVTSWSAIWPPWGVGSFRLPRSPAEERSARLSRTSIGMSSRDFASCRRPAFAPQSDLQRTSYVGRRNPVQGRLRQVDLQIVLRLGILDVPVNIDDAGCLLKDLLDLCGQRDLALIVGTVDFGDQRLQYRRAGRDF